MEKDPNTNDYVSTKAEQAPDVIEPEKNTKKSPEQIYNDYLNDTELVEEFSEFLGMNFNYDLIIDGRVEWSENDKRYKELVKDLTTEQINEARIENYKKISVFMGIIESLKGKLKNPRICPFAPLSPMSTYQCVKKEKGENGIETRTVEISPTFIKQMEILTEACPDTTLVVPFYNKDREPENERSNVPNTKEDIDDYVNICLQLVDKLGDSITIEIGNETNATHQLGGEFSGSASEQISSKADPDEYAKFYCEVAARIKKEHPDVKLSVAGTAFYDETYMSKVLNTIDDESDGKTSKLVDVISYHPYGDFNSDDKYYAASVEGGEFVETKIDFDEQHKRMETLANDYGINQLNIGEINFLSGDENQRKNLKKWIEQNKNKGLMRLWPSAQMPSAV